MFKFKFKQGTEVIHRHSKGEDRAIIVGLCFVNDWDTEARYGIELLDKKFKSTRHLGMSEVLVEYKIVKAVVESSLTLIAPPKKTREETLAEVVAQIESEDPKVEPSGV